LEGEPTVPNEDAYAPRSASINKDAFINKWALRSELLVRVFECEYIEPPLEIGNDRFQQIMMTKLVTLEGGSKVREG